MVTTHIATRHRNILLRYCYDLPLNVLSANNFHDGIPAILFAEV